jgi:hypothetical protein
MSFWASAMLWGPGYLPKHDRYGGWPLRNATDAAFILPDGHPMKQYFNDFVRRTVEYMVKHAAELQKTVHSVPAEIDREIARLKLEGMGVKIDVLTGLVGGLDRVYEIGRIFRNEGISTKHNPEF